MFQQRVYSTVLQLSPGSHTLWHGLIANNPGTFSGWDGSGWIDAVDILPKVYPAVFDNRAAPDPTNGIVRDPGCYNGNSGSNAANACKSGEAFWSSTDFFVPYGYGGAIASFGEGTITISDSLFDENQAGRGTVFSAVAADELVVRNSSVQADDPFPIYLENSRPQSTCQEASCDLGMRCDFARLSLVCTTCQRNEIGNGRTCVACPPGSSPNPDQTECMMCMDGYRSSLGICEPCEAGKVSSNDRVTCTDCLPGTATGVSGIACEDCPGETISTGQQVECNACPPGKQPNADHTGCEGCPVGRAGTDGTCNECPPGKETNDDHTGCNPCEPMSAIVEGVCVECSGRQVPSPDRSACICKPGTYSQEQLGLIQCHGDIRDADLDDECIECASCLNCAELGEVQFASGWAVYGIPGNLYQCPLAEACPAQTIWNVSSTVDSTCAVGYTGPVCGDCEDGYNHLCVSLVPSKTSHDVTNICSECGRC